MRGFWDRGWLPTVAAKSSYFHAVAQYQLGLASQAQKSFGEAVARMKVGEICFLCVGVRGGRRDRHQCSRRNVLLQRGMELVTEAEKKGEGHFKPYVSEHGSILW